MNKIAASAVLIAKNEEKNLPKTLEALRDFREIIVVDSGSSDRTCEIAREHGARVYQRAFDDFSSQKNFAVEQAGGPWIFSIDADEVPDPVLLDSIRQISAEAQGPRAGYSVLRRNRHFGRELKWGGQGKDYPLRVFQKGRGRFVNPVHEYIKLDGAGGRIPGTLMHESTRNASEYLEKLAQYSALESALLRKRGKRPSFWHWGIKPGLRFFLRYVLQLGFMDGFEGFLFHALSSFNMAMKYARCSEEEGKLR